MRTAVAFATKQTFNSNLADWDCAILNLKQIQQWLQQASTSEMIAVKCKVVVAMAVTCHAESTAHSKVPKLSYWVELNCWLE